MAIEAQLVSLLRKGDIRWFEGSPALVCLSLKAIDFIEGLKLSNPESISERVVPANPEGLNLQLRDERMVTICSELPQYSSLLLMKIRELIGKIFPPGFGIESAQPPLVNPARLEQELMMNTLGLNGSDEGSLFSSFGSLDSSLDTFWDALLSGAESPPRDQWESRSVASSTGSAGEPIKEADSSTTPRRSTRAQGRGASSKASKKKASSNGQKRRFSCLDPKCDRTFNTWRKCNRHMREHPKYWPFQCGYCGKGNNRMDNLRAHVKTHYYLRKIRKSIQIVKKNEDGRIVVTMKGISKAEVQRMKLWADL